MNQRKKSAKTCPICGSPSDGALCSRHKKAMERLERHYGVWKKRADMEMGWEEYLHRMAGNEMAGTWVREAAGYALKAELREPKVQNT